MMAEPSYQYSQQRVHRKPMPTHLQPDRPYPSQPMSPAHSHHSHSRTSSSSVFPHPSPTISYPAHQHQHMYTSRRTPSTTTFSTTASSSGGTGHAPRRQPSHDLRRSTSSRSANLAPASGYVALMRKQKATVWCDRAQHEDPRMVAAQKAAKQRAAMEVLGGPAGPGKTVNSSAQAGSIVGSNRVTAKIRHHGKAGLVGYSPAENFGVGVGGVPLRLSATEVENGDSDDGDAAFPSAQNNHRSGSGRSSLGSAKKNRGYRASGASGASSARYSAGHTPPSEREGRESISELAETSVAAPDARSTRSGSSGERNDAVAELGDGAARGAATSGGAGGGGGGLLLKSAVRRERSVRNPEELRRRGSVDERTATMSAQRLYIANPDEDSD